MSVRAAAAAEQATFVEIYEAHADRIYAFLLLRVPASVAEDLTAEVFLQAWRQRRRVAIDAELGWLPWLYGVARNLARAQARIDVRSVPVEVDDTARWGVDPDFSQSVADRIVTSERARAALEAVATLAEPERTIVELCYLADLTPNQVAIAMDMKPATVRSHLFRARKRLAQHLQAHQPLEVHRDAR